MQMQSVVEPSSVIALGACKTSSHTSERGTVRINTGGLVEGETCVFLVQFPAIIMRLETVLKELPDERLNPASVPTPHSCCTVQ